MGVLQRKGTGRIVTPAWQRIPEQFGSPRQSAHYFGSFCGFCPVQRRSAIHRARGPQCEQAKEPSMGCFIKTRSPRDYRVRLNIEALEDRLVPSAASFAASQLIGMFHPVAQGHVFQDVGTSQALLPAVQKMHVSELKPLLPDIMPGDSEARAAFFTRFVTFGGTNPGPWQAPPAGQSDRAIIAINTWAGRTADTPSLIGMLDVGHSGQSDRAIIAIL